MFGPVHNVADPHHGQTYTQACLPASRYPRSHLLRYTPPMLRPHRFDAEIDPGPVQIQARKVHFDLAGIPLEWIPGHPVASTMINLFNVVLPAAEHWFVTTFNEALPLVKDPRLADDMRGFIGQEAMHAAAHDDVIEQFLVGNGVDPSPILNLIGYMFEKTLAPTTSTDPRR